MIAASSRLAQTTIAALALISLAACGGRLNTVNDFHTQTLSEEMASTAQGEIHEVMQAAQSGILATILEADELDTATCKPKLSFALIGIGFKFSDDASCHLRGTVMVKLFPLRATVDLEAVGMKYVERMTFDADVSLKSENGISIGWEFYNGRINLKNFALLPIDELVLNGVTNASLVKGAFSLQSRTNAFDGASGFGVALSTNFGNGNHSVQACLLTGGVGSDPYAGSVKSCLALLQ
ncbi:MAG: hypothetical protein KDD39_04900 [Bdellovibrionales bacterium]|nr:hypothetical protein [Bdellovibrionales bacterium]